MEKCITVRTMHRDLYRRLGKSKYRTTQSVHFDCILVVAYPLDDVVEIRTSTLICSKLHANIRASRPNEGIVRVIWCPKIESVCKLLAAQQTTSFKTELKKIRACG